MSDPPKVSEASRLARDQQPAKIESMDRQDLSRMTDSGDHLLDYFVSAGTDGARSTVSHRREIDSTTRRRNP